VYVKRIRFETYIDPEALVVDTGASSVIPTISISQAESDQPSKTDTPDTDNNEPTDSPVPGAMPDGPASAIPDWYKVGWRAAGGIDDQDLSAGTQARDKSILAQFVDEQYYGAWYHNAALIFFVSLVPIMVTTRN
jgi:hypothetical protein